MGTKYCLLNPLNPFNLRAAICSIHKFLRNDYTDLTDGWVQNIVFSNPLNPLNPLFNKIYLVFNKIPTSRYR